MNNNPHGFRDKLIATEPVNHDLQLNYEQEMEKMFTDEIKGIRRLGWWAKNILLLALGLALLLSAIFNQPISMPVVARWLWAMSGVFTLVMALLGFRIGWHGKMNLRKDSNLMAGFGFAGMFVIANALLFAGFLSRNIGDLVIIAPMVMLIIIIGILVSVENRVKQSELNTRENLLEIKYQLAELSEHLQNK